MLLTETTNANANETKVVDLVCMDDGDPCQLFAWVCGRMVGESFLGFSRQCINCIRLDFWDFDLWDYGVSGSNFDETVKVIK